MRIGVMLSLAFTCAPLAAAAQGTISGQGFGYPAGQFGARASATGGALAPFDQVSPVNPAALAQWQRSVLYFHIEPEFRSTSFAGSKASTRVSRFPLVGGASRVAEKGAVALTFSTYLDRTWETVSSTSSAVGDTVVDIETRYASLGAVNDIRIATGWTLSPSLRVGLGYHAYTGENRLTIAWDFADETLFGDVSQETRLAYSGRAVSAGAEWTKAGTGAVSAYGRLGGAARLRASDTLIAEARMPNHVGVAARYDGFAGTVVALGWERIGWSSLADLGSSTLGARDADRISIGSESRGPQVGSAPMALRAGVSYRTLPFAARGVQVKETSFALGAGFTVARGRGNVDLTLLRAARKAGDASEGAWRFMLGVAITP